MKPIIGSCALAGDGGSVDTTVTIIQRKDDLDVMYCTSTVVGL